MKKIKRLAAAFLCGILVMAEAGTAAAQAASADGQEYDALIADTQEYDTSVEDTPGEEDTKPLQAGKEEEPDFQEETQSSETDEAVTIPETDEAATASETDIAGGTAEIGGKLTWVIDQSGKLTVEGTGDAAENPWWDGMPWQDYCEQILSAEIKVAGMTNATNLFKGCRNLASVDVSGFDTSKVTSMYAMFSGCEKLTSLDVSHFNTSKTSDMRDMFNGCSGLISLDVRGFDTSKVTGMSDMFNGCSSLSNLNVSRFDTRNVGNMRWMFAGCENLSSLDVKNFDTHKVTYMDGMFNSCSSLTSLDVSGFDTSQVENMSYMFAYCDHLTGLDLSGFDTSQVTNMLGMFQNCTNLASLDLRMFDTSQVTDMRDMFWWCEKLASLDLRHFDTSKVTSVTGMFWMCDSLTSLNLSSFDLGSAEKSEEDYSYFLPNSSNLRSIHTPVNVKNKYELPDDAVWYQAGRSQIANLPLNLNYSILITKGSRPQSPYPYITADKTKKRYAYGETLTLDDLTVMYYESAGNAVKVADYTTNAAEIDMFVPGIKELTVTYKSWTASVWFQVAERKDAGNISGIIDETYGQIMWMIDDNGKLTIRGTGDLTKDTEYYRAPWYTYNYKVKSAVLAVDGMTDASYLFYGCSHMASVDLSRFDTSQLVNTEGMFVSCESLTSLDVSGFDTSKVISMRGMFSGCENITNLDISHFDTGQTTRMDAMFSGCKKLASVDVSKFDTRKVTNMQNMFGGCENLASLDVSGFDTSQVTDLSYMFMSCEKLTALDVTHFVTSQVTNMNSMFSWCTKLEILDISRFDTGRVKDMAYMFCGCDNLSSLDLSHFDTSQVTDMSLMLSCENLTQVDVSNFDTRKVTEIQGMFQQCKKLKTLDVSSFDVGGIDAEYSFYNWLSGCDSLVSIKTPMHVKNTVELPVTAETDVWYQEGISGAVTEFPKDLAYSVLLEKNKVPDSRYPYLTAQKTKFRYECGEQLNTDDLTVLYYKQAGEGEKVTAYTTNADSIDMSVPGKKELVITYEGQTASVKLTVVEKPEEILPEPVTYTVTFDLQGHGTALEEYAGYTGINEGALISEPTAPSDTGFDFEGWYKEPSCENKWDFLADTITGDTTLYARWIVKKDYGEILPEDLPENGEIPDGLWAASIEDRTYTGKAIKPKVHVYWGKERLDPGIDYTVKYKNNTKVNDASDPNNAPGIIIKGKNHCSGEATVYFKILPVDLSAIDADDMVLAYTGKVQKKAPVIKWNGKKLSSKKDIKITYPDENKSGAYREEGTYAVRIGAAGDHFTGNKILNLTIRKGISMNRAKVKKIKSQSYTGEEIKPALEVTVGKNTLAEGKDYSVLYKNCTEIGTATAVLTGNGEYAGTKTVTYKITGTSLKGAKVEGLSPVVYDGTKQEPKVTVTARDQSVLTEKKDYVVTYSDDNKNAGRATIIITGINRYTGTVKKTFKILPYDLENDTEGLVKGLDEELTAPYDQDGSKPDPALSFKGRRLLCGRDYSMTCKNNKSVTYYNTVRKPEVTIKGKGNFKGKITREFRIIR